MFVLGVLSLALFLIAVDASILNVALPQIAEDLNPDAAELLWIVDSYSLTVAALLITMAAVGDRFGRRRMLRLGLLLFSVAIVIAAASTSPLMLIGARVLLGVGGAMAMPATLSILRSVFTDDRERAVAVGVWSAVGAAGFVLGPVLSGLILNAASWPWVFWAQLPLLAIVLLAILRVPESVSPGHVTVDVVGVVLSAVGMVTLVFAIKQLGKNGLLDISGLLLIASGVACLAVFVIQQLRRARPMIDMRLFRSTRFSSATIAVLACNVALSAPLLLLTQQLQIVQGLTPLQAGLNFLPIAFAAIIAGPLTPRLVAKIGMNGAVASAFTVIAAGLALIAQVTSSSPYTLLLSGSILLGAGVSVAASSASAALLAAAPATRSGNAAAVQETAYELGVTLGISLFGSIALSAYRNNLSLPSAFDPALATAIADGLPQAAAAAAEMPQVLAVAITAFEASFSITLNIAAVAVLAIALLAAIALPRDRAASAIDH
jgi:DHA2 family multidrug resistance protein-like MFS transporter